MLSGYIDIYIRENYIANDKDTILTFEKLKAESQKLNRIWELFTLKQTKCNFGVHEDEKMEKLEVTF